MLLIIYKKCIRYKHQISYVHHKNQIQYRHQSHQISYIHHLFNLTWILTNIKYYTTSLVPLSKHCWSCKQFEPYLVEFTKQTYFTAHVILTFLFPPAN